MISEKIFGRLQNGSEVKAFTLESGAVKAVVLEYGCAVQSIELALSGGEKRDVMLGYDSIEGYENGSVSQGAFVGRFANRIKGASFELGGKVYSLEKNDGGNHLHGAFAKKLFSGVIKGDCVVLRAQSPSGEDGFPGNMSLEVTYSLSSDGALTMHYSAQCDEDTLINLTNHSYFNLDGQASGTALNHTLWLNSKEYCEADAETCATGRILPVDGTPMDFTVAKEIGRDINADFTQLVQAKGYDHNFVLNKPENELALCAMAKSSDCKIIMELYTTQPGVQLYAANFLNEQGKGGVHYGKHDAFCLETQHYPCSPSYEHFPTTVLKKGDVYEHTTIYKIYEV